MNLSAMPTEVSGILFVALPTVASVAAVYFVRRLKSHEILKENNEFASITYPIIALIYGVFLAFAIIIAWGRFSDAEQSAVNEVTHLSQLWRDSEVFPKEQRDQMHKTLIGYTRAVKDKEWSSMAKERKADEDTKKAYRELWKSYYAYEPQTESQKAFYAASIDQINEIGRNRRQRIMFSSAEVPAILWAFVICGGFITVAFCYLLGTKHGWSQALICGLITALISFSIFVVFSLQHPFTGDVSISNQPYAELLRSFEERR